MMSPMGMPLRSRPRAPKKDCLTSCGVFPAAARSLGQAPNLNRNGLQPGVFSPASEPGRLAYDAATGCRSGAGALYESTNPTESASTVIGTGNWTRLSTPWGSSSPTLASADINQAGVTELWTRSGSTLSPYILNTSTSTLSAETTGSSAAAPADDWPLTDGSTLAQGPSATTATNSISGAAATLNGGIDWSDDDYFSTDLTLDGQTGYLTPPAATLPDSDFTPSISIWFKTTTPDGILASIQNQAFSPGTTAASNYTPIL
jgi:hypothetical protein